MNQKRHLAWIVGGMVAGLMLASCGEDSSSGGGGGQSNGTGGAGASGGAGAGVGGGNPMGSAGNSTAGAATTGGGSSTATGGWLRVDGNKILTSDGKRFHGRGANIFDTRQCGSCAYAEPNVDEVIRRIDELVDVWHANFMRLPMVAFASANEDGMTLAQWGDVLKDPAYLADMVKIVNHVGTKPGVYVMLTSFHHPAIDDNELPTAAMAPVYEKLVETFKDAPHVIFGLTNEPHGTTDEAVWTAMNNAVATIRAAEPSGGPRHLIAVQGTQSYARETAYYITHPITAGGGENVIYETHVYNHSDEWTRLMDTPAASLPLIVGEFGPDGTYMSQAESAAFMPYAEALGVPYLGWSFSPECGVPMIKETSNNNWDDCQGGIALTPSPWGQALKTQLALPW